MDKIQNINYTTTNKEDILDRITSKMINQERNKKPLKEYQMFEGLKKPKKNKKK